ncbi:MAG: SpoVG family protein [Omnitrophica bacterium]|nr:SpoVG family protein [Candidatus Omnitrophota bacterium]
MNELLSLKIDRMNRLEGESKVKAFCDLVFGDLFLVKGFKVVEGEKGLFVSMPQQQGKHGKWFNIFWPITTELKEYIGEVVLQAYKGEEQ